MLHPFFYSQIVEISSLVSVLFREAKPSLHLLFTSKWFFCYNNNIKFQGLSSISSEEILHDPRANAYKIYINR